MNRNKRMSAMTVAVLELVKISLALAGLFILVDDGSMAYVAYTSQFWPTTSGEVMDTYVETFADSSGKRSYQSRVKFAYAVDPAANDDETFISYRVTVDPPPRAESRAIAEARLEPYPEGSSVVVYYNPRRPDKSILEPKFLLGYLTMPLVGLLCLIGAIVLWRVQKATSW